MKKLSAKQVALLKEWGELVPEAVKAKLIVNKEQELRKKVARAFFPSPDEGTNKLPLAQGYTLKLVHKITRKVDETTLPAVKNVLREEHGVNPDPLIRYKPELAVKAYKDMILSNPDAVEAFDEVLTVSPGSPELTLIPPVDEEA